MADIRSIAIAWEARAADINSYRIGTMVGEIPPSDVEAALVPTYIKALPLRDGFGAPFQFRVEDEGQVYEIRSFGRNGRLDAGTPKGELDDPDLDIVYSNGSFISYPRGVTAR